MTPTLDGMALEWGGKTPRLVHYMGRVEQDAGAAAVVSDGETRVVVPHATVFWFAGVCSEPSPAYYRLSPVYGNA